MENYDSWNSWLREQKSWLREQWRRTIDAQTSVAVIFAGIAALFIAGIAAAFIYAKDTNPTQTASTPSIANAPGARAPETTGSGGINYIPPKQHPGENEQKERP